MIWQFDPNSRARTPLWCISQVLPSTSQIFPSPNDPVESVDNVKTGSVKWKTGGFVLSVLLLQLMWKTSSQDSAWQRRTSRPSLSTKITKVLSVVQWVRRQCRLLSDTKRHWFWASHACQNLYEFIICWLLCVYVFSLRKDVCADVMVGSTWWSRCCTESNFYPWSVEPLWKKAKLGRFCQRLASKISWSRPFTTLKCGQRWYQMEMLQAEFDYHWVKCSCLDCFCCSCFNFKIRWILNESLCYFGCRL